ncbi:MAG TPA: chemotaxis protein CheA [Bryobacteraceae bacterium]|nr:chemotaxis protein CheA [Bryobacteraceae bacterium]
MPQDTGAVNPIASDPELLSDFIVESREHLNTIEQKVLALEQDAADQDAIHATFRAFHTIKGLAGFLELVAVQEVAHEVETLLDRARNGMLAINARVIDSILASKDYVGIWLDQLDAMLQRGETVAAPENATLLADLRRVLEERAAPVTEAASTSSIQELARAVSTPSEAAPEGSAAARAVVEKTEARSIKVDTARLDYLVDMVGEMVIAQSLVRHDPDLEAEKRPRLVRNLSQLARITNEVQRTAMSMRMVPVRQLFRKMSRLVRDLSRKTGKRVELELYGEDTELDRNIVEELGDPLMHMVRNAVDHGIETPEDRARSGKPDVARVRLGAAHQAGHIVIEVSDDGRGLNKEKIVARAVERGLLEAGTQPSEDELFHLIFQPGFSTAEKVTDVSGRGVGMDVVKKQIQKLRGRVDIQSTPGAGAIFLLKLPLTLAIIDGLVARVGAERYIVPIFAVREMLRPTEDMISTVQGRAEMVLIRGSLLPIVRLHERFGVTPRTEKLTEALLIVAEGARRRFCLMVDDLLGKQEVVIKSLGESLQRIDGVAGGAILGDGRVGLILDLEGLVGDAHGE